MITSQQLEHLKKLRNDGSPVISLYLNTDLETKLPEKYITQSRSFLGEKEGLISADDRKAIQGFVQNQVGRETAGVAAFSCAERGFFLGIRLPQAPQDGIYFGSQAYLKPLEEAFDNFQSTAIVFVDRTRAKLMFWQYGVLTQESLETEVPGQHDQGGWSQARYQRKIKDKLGKHLGRVAEHLFGMYKKQKFDKLILVADEPILAKFEKLLHPYLKERITKRVKKDLLTENANSAEKALDGILFPNRDSL